MNLITTKSAAEILGVTPVRVRQLIQQGQLVAEKHGRDHGFTNVWERNALHCGERLKAPNGKAAHLNQKPLDLMSLIIKASSDEGDVVWETFGGLFSASFAAEQCRRKAFAAEIDRTYFQLGVERFKPGDRVKTLRGSMGGTILRVLPDGRVVWCADSGAELTGLPESLIREKKP